MTNAENKNDFHADSSPANDNDSNKAPVTVTSAAGALASVSLAALKVALNGVDTMSGRSDHQTMLFKARLGDGTYVFGPKQTAPEEGSRWAFNPATFQRGYVCFSDSGKKLGERLLPVTQPMVDRATLPDTGFPWAEEWTVNMKCLDGSDAGKELTFKSTTFGGIQAVRDFLLGAIRDRINGDQHDGKVVPIALLEKDGYKNEYGPQRNPVFRIIDWMALSGPPPVSEPVSPPPPPPPEHPRRRPAAVA